MSVRDAMTTDVLTAARDETVAEAARRMIVRWVGAAVVDPGPRPGIVTERDLVRLIGERRDPATTRVAELLTAEATCAAPAWSLMRAAEAMLAGGFRHLIVTEHERTVGVISIRDIARAWTKGRPRRFATVQIRDAMTRALVTVHRDERLFEVARSMVDARVAAAVVEPARRRSPPHLITDRDMLRAVGEGADLQTARVADHLSTRMTFSAPDWSLLQAGEAMVRGGFQHVVVVDARGTVGLISMPDVIRHWIG